jgi:peptide/nickel transport system permease protein
VSALNQPDTAQAARPVPAPARARAPGRAISARPARYGAAFWVCVAWLCLIAGSAILAPVLPLKGAAAVNPFERLLAPGSHGYLLGSDELGRDVLSRIIYGSRVSLVVGCVSVVIGLVPGTILGVLAGYLRGRIDAVIMWAVDVIVSFPALVLLIAVVAFVGQSLTSITVILGFLAVPIFTRLSRAQTLAVSEREFVQAARAVGTPRGRIMRVEVLPNVLPSVLSYALISVGLIIVVEGSLSFLGLSVSAPTPSWGGLIAEGEPYLGQDPWLVVIPSIVMCLTVLALNLSGETLRRRYETTGLRQ